MTQNQSRQDSVILVAALHKISPGKKLPGSRKFLEAWASTQPISQAPACPEEVAFALANLAVAVGQSAIGAAMLLTFCGLRIGEAIALVGDKVVFMPDAVILFIDVSKRGRDQRVVLTNPVVIAWLHNYSKQAKVKPDQKFCNTSYSKYRFWLKRLCDMLGVGDLGFSSHSFRRGGASSLLIKGVPISNIVEFGRWANENSCRDYLRRGEVYQLRLKTQLSPHLWSRINLLASASNIIWALPS
ncbi:unnamed protein product [Polarella glacialis]|uniref:Tyr recombinase domain-containing protein n=1 Tax=Polarella glacialis TaxID=89957 RepID=A0A813IG27_POLGL|nr:unnamed protein product [Polarella glacialis]